MVLEGIGDLTGAKVHWKRYLELNPASQWADYVRRRLEEGRDNLVCAQLRADPQVAPTVI